MKKLSLLSILFIAISLISSAANAAPYQEINADELLKLKEANKNIVIIDARAPDWFDGTMIEGANQLSAAETNAASMAKIAPSKSQPVVFYCTNDQCPASAKAAYKASALGYKNLYKYKAGIEDWKKRGLPVTTQDKQ